MSERYDMEEPCGRPVSDQPGERLLAGITDIAAREGGFAALTSEQPDDLATGIAGPLLQAGDEGWDDALTVWNGMVAKGPALVLQPPSIGWFLCHSGADAATDLAAVRALPAPIVDLVCEMPYADLRSLFDSDLPKGLRYYEKTEFLPGCRALPRSLPRPRREGCVAGRRVRRVPPRRRGERPRRR